MFSFQEGSFESSSLYRFSSLCQTNKLKIIKIKSILVIKLILSQGLHCLADFQLQNVLCSIIQRLSNIL
jgi:hypothetical protein